MEIGQGSLWYSCKGCSVAEVRSFVQMDKNHELCGLGKVSCPSVHQSWVNRAKSPAFCSGYSLCALFCLQKETGNLMLVKMNYLPLLLFLSQKCTFLWLDWFPRAGSHLEYFLTHVGTLHSKIHAPIQLMSICPSAAVAEGFSPLPQKDLVLQQISLLDISVLLIQPENLNGEFYSLCSE